MCRQNLIKSLLCIVPVVGGLFLVDCPGASAQTVLRNICRIKGQEENVLRGMGLVVGLNGTGEANDASTMRALSRAMEIMGSPIPQTGLPGTGSQDELKKIKNVAMVWVTATVPATGARRGDKLDCYVSGINGKSLEGGRLAFAALQGPNTQDHSVYALAEGALHLEDPSQPLVATISGGCQMEEDVFTPFVQDGQITLVLDPSHANFQTANDIADGIRENFFQRERNAVQTLNAANIRVPIPQIYQKDPVEFVSILLEQKIYNPEPEARIVINQRTGSIVISGDVEIGDVVVSHKNIVVEAGEATKFTEIDPSRTNTAKLQSLVEALNSLKVPNEDAIEIIKGIERNGKLHGRLIME